MRDELKKNKGINDEKPRNLRFLEHPYLFES
jgi:hypothetical protein